MYFLILLFFVPSMFASAATLRKDDFTTWTRADVKTFGCFLEKKLGHRDEKFNCSLKNYAAPTDVCKDNRYYEGPTFPQDVVPQINRQFDSIDLSWEHGQLQSVNITLKKRWTEVDARHAFHLPKEASVQTCSYKHSCITLNGFDHMGSGDVECPAK